MTYRRYSLQCCFSYKDITSGNIHEVSLSQSWTGQRRAHFHFDGTGQSTIWTIIVSGFTAGLGPPRTDVLHVVHSL